MQKLLEEHQIFSNYATYIFYQPGVVLHLTWRDEFIHDSCTYIEDVSKHALLLEKLFSLNVKKAVMRTMHDVVFMKAA